MAQDRNQTARDREQAQREAAQQLQKFARAMSEGKTGMIDRFGAKIDPGSFVLYRPVLDLIFEVLDVAPVLDMTRPPGTIRVRLVAQTDVEFVAGQRAMLLVKCGEKAKDEEGKTDLLPPGGQKVFDFPSAGDVAAVEEVAEPTPELSDPKPVDDITEDIDK